MSLDPFSISVPLGASPRAQTERRFEKGSLPSHCNLLTTHHGFVLFHVNVAASPLRRACTAPRCPGSNVSALELGTLDQSSLVWTSSNSATLLVHSSLVDAVDLSKAAPATNLIVRYTHGRVHSNSSSSIASSFPSTSGMPRSCLYARLFGKADEVTFMRLVHSQTLFVQQLS